VFGVLQELEEAMVLVAVGLRVVERERSVTVDRRRGADAGAELQPTDQ